MKVSFKLILLLLAVVNCDINMNYAYCGHDRFEPDKMPVYEAGDVLPEDDFKPIRIKADSSHYLGNRLTAGAKQRVINAFESACRTMEKLVKVQRFRSITVSRNAFNNQNEFEATTPAPDYTNYDLIVYLVQTSEIGDAISNGRATYLYGNNTRPIAGLLKVNFWLNIENQNNAEVFFHDQFLHALTHIMVFSDKLYTYYKTNPNKLIDRNIRGQKKYLIATPKVVEAAKEYFNCTAGVGEDKLEGLELEKSLNGHKGSHWESRIMLGDLMIEAAYNEAALSKMTLALFEDSGWYQVNYYTGGLFRFGKMKGCGFLKDPCIDIETDKPRYKNEFVAKDDKNHEVCSASRQSRGYGCVKNYKYGTFSGVDGNLTSIFKSINIGGWEGADFCPVSYDRPNDERAYYGTLIDGGFTSFDYYYSSCKVGNDKFGSLVYGSTTWTTPSLYKGFFESKTGDHSFCALSKVLNRPVYSTNPMSILEYLVTPPYRAICLEMHCSATKLTIQAGNDLIVCPLEGGLIKLPNEKGEILCPDFNLICTGTKMCNYITDCIDKKSEEKPSSFNYNKYTSKPKTTIDTTEADSLMPSEDYESSDDGKCAINCSRCTLLNNGNTQCNKCKEGFSPYTDDESILEYKCMETTVLETGPYYLKDGIYHPCEANCGYCKSKDVCLRCKDNFLLVCDIDPTDGVEKSGCKAKDQVIPYYYYEDAKMCYIKCDSAIANCEKCLTKEKCDSCYTNFALLDYNYKKCEAVPTGCGFYQETSYTKGLMYRSCSKNNVGECSCCHEAGTCDQCNAGYCDLDGDPTKCYLVSELTATERFYEETPGHCKTCNKTIGHCEKCLNKDSCKECEYAFCPFDAQRKVCHDVSNGRYYRDPNDICHLCADLIPHCRFCRDTNICDKCEPGYVLDKDHHCIPEPTKPENDTQCPEYTVKDGLYLKCTDFLPNSATCANAERICRCANGFTMVNNNFKECVKIDPYLNNPEYYPAPGYDGVKYGPMYYQCSENKFNMVENCLQCHERKTCDKCKTGFTLLDDQVDECYDKSKLTHIVHSCDDIKCTRCNTTMPYCLRCDVGDHCDRCDDHFCTFNRNYSQCIDVADGTYYNDTTENTCFKCNRDDPHCLYCKDLQHCRRCEDGYGLNEDLKCEPLTTLEDKHHYQEGNIYYKCDRHGGVANCDECLAKDKCTKCKSGFILKEGDGKVCHPIGDCHKNKDYSPDGDINCYSCSGKYNNVPNCEECTEKTSCQKCKAGYYFFNGDYKRCYKKEEIETEAYLKTPDMYESCNIPLPNCDTCEKDASGALICTKCSYGWCTIGNNKKQCVDVSTGTYYYDRTDKTCYTCESAMEGCITCESKDKCFDCQPGYLLNLIDNKCHKKNIDHCEHYGFDGTILKCRKCEDGYSIIDGDDTVCLPSSTCPEYPYQECFSDDKNRTRYHCNRDDLFTQHKFCKYCTNSKTCEICKTPNLRYTNSLTCGPAKKHCIEMYDKDTCTQCEEYRNATTGKYERMFLVDGECATCGERGCTHCDLLGRCVKCPIDHCVVCVQDYVCGYCEDGYIVTDYYGYCALFPIAQYSLLGTYGLMIDLELEINFQMLIMTTSSASIGLQLNSGMGIGRRLVEGVEFTCSEETSPSTEPVEGVPRVATLTCKTIGKAGRDVDNKDLKLTKINSISAKDSGAIFYGTDEALSNKVDASAADDSNYATVKFETYNLISCLNTSYVNFQVIGTLSKDVASQSNVELDVFSPKTTATCEMDVENKVAVFNCKVDAKYFTKELNNEMMILSDKPIKLEKDTLYPVDAKETPIREVTPLCNGDANIQFKEVDCGGKTNLAPIIALAVVLVVVAAGGVFGVLYFRKEKNGGKWFC